MSGRRHSLTTLTTAMASLPVPLGSPGTTKASPRRYPVGRDAEPRVRSCWGKSDRAVLVYLEEWWVCIPGAGRWEGCFAGQHLWGKLWSKAQWKLNGKLNGSSMVQIDLHQRCSSQDMAALDEGLGETLAAIRGGGSSCLISSTQEHQ